jgi:hypothetical protein
VYLDEGALRIHGLESRYSDPSEVLGKANTGLIAYIHPQKALHQEILKKKHISNLEYPFITLDAVVKWAMYCAINNLGLLLRRFSTNGWRMNS